MEYLIYTPEEQITVAEDYLRNAEATHYRLSLLPPTDPTRDTRLADAEKELARQQKEYKALRAKIDKDAK